MHNAKRLLFLLVFGLTTFAGAKEKGINGTVTYVTGGTVYTSLGKASGVQDSSIVFVIDGPDTIATLRVIASSSKSTACSVLTSRRQIKAGNTVVAYVPLQEEKQEKSPGNGETPSSLPTSGLPLPTTGQGGTTTESSKPFAEIKGRVSAQYYTTRYDNSSFDISQPGVVLNFRAKSNDVPIIFEVYSNFRTLAYGTMSPFSKHARNQSRIYRLSLGYDDGLNVISFGRIAPTVAPSIGYIDGTLLSRKLGAFTVGTALGFRPTFVQQGVSTENKKAALFLQYELKGGLQGSVTAAYARDYFHSQLDREVASTSINLFTSGDLFVYASSEVDLRTKSGDALKLHPALTTAFMNVNYRFTRELTVGLGGDASRPFYPFSSVRTVPDSLLDHRLRGGLTLNVNILLPGGVSLYNTFTPRSRGSQFAQDYSEYAAVTLADIAASGITFRTNVTVNSTEFTNSLGYGVNLQSRLLDVVDLALRYQKYNYTVKRIAMRSNSTTFGSDIMVPLTNYLSLVASYDRLDGYGTKSNSLFTELSVRF